MSLTYAPFAGLENVAPEESSSSINVGSAERIGSALIGAALSAYGLSRRDLPGALLGVIGSLLIYRGASGNCSGYRALGIDTTGQDGRGVPGDAGIRVEKSVEIQRSALDLYHFWRDLTELPLIMPHVKSVTVSGERSHWIVQGPAGTEVAWNAEFINDEPGALIAWQSLPGSDVRNAGSVRFEPVGDGRSTRVKVALEYLPVGGRAGAFVAKLLGASPERQLKEDLARFEERIENQSAKESEALVGENS